MQNMHNYAKYAYFCYRYKTVTARRDGSPTSTFNGHIITTSKFEGDGFTDNKNQLYSEWFLFN